MNHCKGCLSFWNAGHKKPKKEFKKYNAWCCAHGQSVEKSIGWCKQHDKKRIVQ